MAVNRLTVDITPDKFPFRAKTTERNVLYPSSDRQDSALAPSWIENYWPLANDQQAAIVAEYGATPDLPTQVIDQFGDSVIQAYQVTETTSGTTIMVVTSTEVWAHTIDGWKLLLTSPTNTVVSVASLKGQTYLHQAGGDLYVVLPPTNTTVPFSEVAVVTTNGVIFTDMISMCASISYLIATDGESVYWSAPLDITQWQPDQAGDQYGAGATKILTVIGQIRFVKPTVDGFYCYTDNNIIHARYTENADSPWSFDEVSNSSGTFNHWSIATDSNIGTAFAWCDNGLAAITNTKAEYGFPEITEFLSGSIYEEFNLTTNLPDLESNAHLDYQLSFIGGRYLCVSYGKLEEVRKYIFMLDIILKKWTRIKIDHVAVVDLRQSAADQGITFDNWTDWFDNSLYTFDEMGGSRATSDVKAATISVITADGHIKRLSPIDIHTLDPIVDFTTLTYEVLPNILSMSDVKLTRNRSATLSEITMFYTYPAFEDELAAPGTTENVQYSNATTLIQASSQEDPTIRDYLVSHARDNEEFYVERVVGTRTTVTLKNTSSLQGVEIGLIPSGNRRI